MKKLSFIIATTIYILCLLCLPAATLAAQDIGLESVDSPLAALDLDAVQEYINQLDAEIKSALPQFSFKDTVINLSRGELDWSISTIFNNIVQMIFKELVANFDLLGKLIILAVICAVLHNLVTAFENSSSGQLAYSITYLVLITIAIGTFTLAVNAGRETVDVMTAIMQALTPVILTMLVAVGGVTTAAIFSPVIMTTLSVFGTMVKDVILPLFFFAAILGIVSNLTDHFKMSNLGNLLKTMALSLMGIFSTIFLGLLTIKGAVGVIGDSVTFRTAKYSVNAFVPVVGGMLSSALETIVSSSLLIKNTVGVAGVIAIASLMVFPLIKIATLAIIYKLAGALIQPISDGKMVSCLNDLGNSLFLVFAAVATAGLMFFFTIAIMVGFGNMAVMLR